MAHLQTARWKQWCVAMALGVGAAMSGGRAMAGEEFLFGGDFPAQAKEPVRELFFETGMNCVRMTGGGYAWAAGMHKKLADDWAGRNLKVYLQLGSHYPSADYFKLKDAWLVDQNGKSGVEDRKAWSVSYSGQHWPQYSYGSEAFRKQLEGDFAKYLKTFEENKNVAGVILHNEPGYFWLANRVFDYSPETVGKFKVWLEKEHGDIATLNKRWGSKYATFAEVVPPTKLPVGEELGAWMDWRRFQVALIGDFLTWEAKFFKEQRGDVPRSTNLAGPLDHWYGIRMADNYVHSAMMDKPGIDLYPTEWTDRVFLPYSMDMTQGVGQGRTPQVLECEVFSAKNWKKYSEAERAEMLRGEVWTFIGHGAKTVLLWGFSRGDNFSLTDGEYNERVGACRDIVHQTKMINIGEFSRAKPKVALCVDTDTYIRATGVEEKVNKSSPEVDKQAHGLYAAMADSHIAADVLLMGQIKAGAWKGYQAIVLSDAMMMDEGTAKELEKFVAGGGVLVAESPLGQMDRWGKMVEKGPGFGLGEVFGVEYKMIFNASEWMTIKSAQGDIGAQVGAVRLVLKGAEIVCKLDDGTPGVTVNKHGKGKAMMLAGAVGRKYMDGVGKHELANFMAANVGEAVSGLRVKVMPEEARRVDTSVMQDGRGNALVVVTNLGSKAAMAAAVKQVDIELMNGKAGAYRGAFVLLPTQSKDGVVRSGPEVLKLGSANGQGVKFSLSEVSAAGVVLLAQDAGPMLAMESGAKVRVGEEVTVTVTCFNPSPKKVTGDVALRLPAGWVDVSGKKAVAVEAFGSQRVVCKAKVGTEAVPGRAVVNVGLTSGNGPVVLGVPVDVQVEAKTEGQK